MVYFISIAIEDIKSRKERKNVHVALIDALYRRDKQKVFFMHYTLNTVNLMFVLMRFAFDFQTKWINGLKIDFYSL